MERAGRSETELPRRRPNQNEAATQTRASI